LDREGDAVKRIIRFRIFREKRNEYFAECLDFPLVTIASSLHQLAKNIPEAIAIALEGEDLAKLGLAADPAIVATIELGAPALPE